MAEHRDTPMDVLRRLLPVGVKNLLRPAYHGGSELLRCLIRTFAKALSLVLRRKLFLMLYHFIDQEIDTSITIDSIQFDATQFRPYERAITLLSKEPDTINWINKFVAEGDVFYDVGANIGVFSLYASIKRGASVLAFEPMCVNYAILNANIHLNGLTNQISAFNIALHDQTTVSHLDLSDFVAGKAGHTFDYRTGEVATMEAAVFKQGVMGMTMDDFVTDHSQPFPNHVKIDVDGNEPKIIDGMRAILTDSRLKTLAVELDPESRPADAAAIEILQQLGFSLLSGDEFLNTTSISWTKVRNYFFVRA